MSPVNTSDIPLGLSEITLNLSGFILKLSDITLELRSLRTHGISPLNFSRKLHVDTVRYVL